jgi:hypothetical protein
MERLFTKPQTSFDCQLSDICLAATLLDSHIAPHLTNWILFKLFNTLFEHIAVNIRVFLYFPNPEGDQGSSFTPFSSTGTYHFSNKL